MSLVRKIAQDERVRLALNEFRECKTEIVDLAISIQQIPAPTFNELERANFIESRFANIGLHDVSQDGIHNVYARWPGNGSGPPVVVSAHSDTVFPIDTDLTVRFENDEQLGRGIIYGPGLADNALGVAGLITLARTIERYRYSAFHDIWFVANVCEEGLGNLMGMQAVIDRFGKARAYLVVEGGSYGHVFHRAIGVRRFKLEVKTPGGHSWGDFGTPSAVHVLSKLISALDDLSLPQNPKTSLNVGVIEGGTTINSIAALASCLIDLRSEDPEVLGYFMSIIEGFVQDANRQPDVQATLFHIGDRPAGAISRQRVPITWAADALHQVGCKQIQYLAGSTDANIPISLGFPAVCIGLAKSANTHRRDEFLDPHDLSHGMGQLLLLTLAAAGFDLK